MKSTFLHQNRPLVTSMVLKKTPEEVRYAVKNSIYEGADALGIQLERIKQEHRTEENYRAIFAACGGRPIYITSYRYCESSGMTDEECKENLLMGLRCGATLGDIPGDAFDFGADMELTYNPQAVERQIALIDEIHAMGKEVLMSSHVQRYIPAEKVLEIAMEQQRRGVDMAKIVTAANSDEEQLENLRATVLLKQNLSIPFMFLSGGTHSKVHRMVGPMLGAMTYLAVLEHDENAVPTQPTVRAAKQVRDSFDFMPDLLY